MRSEISIKLVLQGLGLMAAVAAFPAAAGDVYVIAHPGVTLSAAELKDTYLGDKQFSDSIKLVPVDNAAVQSEFLAKVLKVDSNKYAATWIKKSFRSGLAAPATKSSDAEVINFVKSTAGAVGYISTLGGAGVIQLQKY